MTKANPYTESGRRMEEQKTTADAGQSLVRRQLEQHQEFIKTRMDLLARWCTHGLRPEALLRFCMLDLQQSETLRKCDTGSIFLGLLACAQSGLEPGALKQEAFLVPFFDGKAKMYRATFIAGWRGLVKQAKRSREVKNIWSEIVRARDLFELDLGTSPRIVHKPQLIGDRGDIIGAYSVAQMSHGLYDPEWMDIGELQRIRSQAKRGERESPAWRDHEGEMYRKTPIRRLAKRLPMGADYFVGAAVEMAQDEGQPEAATVVLDSLTDGEASRAEKDAMTGRTMAQQVAGLSEDDKRDIEQKENQGGNE